MKAYFFQKGNSGTFIRNIGTLVIIKHKLSIYLL